MQRLLTSLALIGFITVPANLQTASAMAGKVDPNPRPATVMVCGDEGQREIAQAMKLKTVQAVRSTWKSRLYSCQYQYRDGSIGVSVKELENDEETTKYFAAMQKKHGKRASFSGVGDAGYITKNGSVVLRKDSNVLFVDVSKLPEKFGNPLRDRVVAAQTVAGALIDCWIHG